MKRTIKLLLIFTLVLQIIAPAMIVASANEKVVSISVARPDSIDEPEDDLIYTLGELDEAEGGDNEDELLNEDFETPIAEIEIDDEALDDGLPVAEEELDDEIESNEASEVEYDGDDDDDDENEGNETTEDETELDDEIEHEIPQTSIETMRTFLENNSADNPFIVPTGLTFVEAINALEWGENITVWPILSGHDTPDGTLWGVIDLLLNSEMDEYILTYEDRYWFSVEGLYVLYEDEATDRPTIPQESIEAMRSFIENNSADNPFIILDGLTFNEAINARDWGEGITVWTPMSGLGSGLACGAVALHLNQQTNEDGEETYDDMYGFWDICIYYDFVDLQKEEIPNDDSQNNDLQNDDSDNNDSQNDDSQTNRSNLPQTGVRLLNASLIGVGVLAVCGVVIYLRNKKKIRF